MTVQGAFNSGDFVDDPLLSFRYNGHAIGEIEDTFQVVRFDLFLGDFNDDTVDNIPARICLDGDERDTLPLEYKRTDSIFNDARDSWILVPTECPPLQ